jgi:hypothetical protein
MDDGELWMQFNAYAIPAAAWDHRAHVRTACLFLLRHDLDTAHLLMRASALSGRTSDMGSSKLRSAVTSRRSRERG